MEIKIGGSCRNVWSFYIVENEGGVVKAKAGDSTDATVYADWYKAVYMPSIAETGNGTDQAGV